MEGLRYSRKFALQNPLGKLIVGKQRKKFMSCCNVFALFYFVFENSFEV